MGDKAGRLNYFDRRAEQYFARSQRGLWGWIRSHESRAVLDSLPDLAGRRTIDFGSGPGYYAHQMRRAGAQVLAVDRSAAMFEQLSKLEIDGRCCAIEDFVTDQPADAAVAAGVLEFVAAPARTFAAMARALKPGGRLVVLVPRGGLIGQIYRLHHVLSGCPTYLHNLQTYYDLAGANDLNLIGERNASWLSQVLVFEKSARAKKNHTAN